MTNINFFLWVLVGFGGLLVGLLGIRALSLRWYQRRVDKKSGEETVFIDHNPSPLLTWLKGRKSVPGSNSIFVSFVPWLSKIHVNLNLLLEITIIVIWALWVGRNYFNFNPNAYPQGGDFPHEVQGHFFWQLLPQCGICFLWNGYLDGGMPSFAELQGAGLHPLVILGTLVWGTVNGVKFILLCSLIMAGLAQWWLARVLKLGWMARLWSGLIIVVCGHIGMNLSNGVTNLVFAIANASLILPPAVDLALNHNRRSIIWLGIALALTILAGQGYIQIGVIAAVIPALVIFVLFQDRKLELWKDYLLAAILALLLSAYMLVPVLHFYPNFNPESGIHYDTVQGLETVFMNFISPNALKINYPIFVGGIPVLLALVALRLAPRDKRGLLWFFIAGILLVCAISTYNLIKFIIIYVPGYNIARFPALISGLAVPFMIGMAAWGLDLVVRLSWPKLSINFAGGQAFTTSSTWLILAIPLIYAVSIAYPIGRRWMYLAMVDKPAQVVQAVQTGSSQWLQFPTVDFLWPPALITQGNYKMTNVYRPWQWLGRDMPTPYVQALNPATDGTPKPGATLIKTVEYYGIYRYPLNQYGGIKTASEIIGCQSNALGGKIDIVCDAPEKGQLIVQEYSWSGWFAWMDNHPVSLKPGEWLSVDAPAGKHTFSFRYRPWDVLLGLILTLLGFGLAIWLGIRFAREMHEQPAEAAIR